MRRRGEASYVSRGGYPIRPTPSKDLSVKVTLKAICGNKSYRMNILVKFSAQEGNSRSIRMIKPDLPLLSLFTYIEQAINTMA